MLLNWKGGGPLSFQNPKDQSMITLMVGHNVVEKKVWDLVKKGAGFKAFLEDGKLEEVVEPDEKQVETAKEEGMVPELSTMRPAAAKKVIADTFDLELLNKWGDEDGRAAIQRAITAQIDKIKNFGAEKKDED